MMARIDKISKILITYKFFNIKGKRLPLDTSILRSPTESQVCSENNNSNERPEIVVN